MNDQPNVHQFEPLPDPNFRVTVEEVAHGGLEVVVRIPAGNDRRQAAALAQDIRTGVVDLSDLGWRG